MAWLNSCCCCCSLKSGTITSGILGILCAIVSLIVMFTTNDIVFKTIILDWLPQWIVKTILAINLVMTVLISILLIIGALKRNTFMMLPWVVLGIMLAIGLLVSVIYTAVVFLIAEHVVAGCLWLVFGILSVVIYVYMWIVVFSYFQTLKDDESRGMYAKAPYKR